MPILAFENRHEKPLTLLVEPWSDSHEIPHLATAGIRLAGGEGLPGYTTCVVSERRIELWCDAERYEIDIVHPSAFDRLTWEICVLGGWCGGIVDDKPTSIDDLLPASGDVTAREFAELVARADGWPASEPVPEKHLRWLEGKFVEHLGAPSADVRELQRNLAKPFEKA